MTLHFQDDVATNILTIDATDPKSGTAEFKATAIRIEKLPEPTPAPASSATRSARPRSILAQTSQPGQVAGPMPGRVARVGRVGLAQQPPRRRCHGLVGGASSARRAGGGHPAGPVTRAVARQRERVRIDAASGCSGRALDPAEVGLELGPITIAAAGRAAQVDPTPGGPADATSGVICQRAWAAR